MHTWKKRGRAALTAAALFAALLTAGSAAHAATSSLLSATDQRQLSQWLGEGAVRFDGLFTKVDGATSRDFHQSVDGKGRTLVVMEATNRAGQTFLLGGYNPQSWSSSGSYNLTNEDGGRTAFLFNLTSGKLFRQMLNAYGQEALGSYQTLNDGDSGPTFGWGHDLQMSRDLSSGYSLLYSYADTGLGDLNLSIADGAAFGSMNDLHYGRMEVYTISAVPEPAQALLLGGGLALLFVVRKRRTGARFRMTAR